jgi:hypothetical protein
MSKAPVVTLRFIGTEHHGLGLFIMIDGRQALHEGPRRAGFCCHCGIQCMGATPSCDMRVFKESEFYDPKRHGHAP